MSTHQNINGISLRPEALALFRDLWDDRENWSGTPLVEAYDAATRADLTNLKRAGLLTTYQDEGDAFAIFTAEGEAFAVSQNS